MRAYQFDARHQRVMHSTIVIAYISRVPVRCEMESASGEHKETLWRDAALSEHKSKVRRCRDAKHTASAGDSIGPIWILPHLRLK